MLLADFGADVIKIEPVPDGDPTRYLQGFGQGFAPYLFRNRRSLSMDLKTEAGLEIVYRLLKTADILIENFGPGTMERLGLGYEALAPDYPRLVYCTLKGFLPGPYEQRIALDEVVQMMSGLAYMTGPPGRPLRAGASIIDMMTGVYGVVGILLALRERQQTGRGQVVRSGLFETAVAVMGHHMAYSFVSGKPVEPMPIRVGAWAIYHQFRVKGNELVFVGVTSDKQWPRFCRAFDRPDLLANPAYATNNDRVLAQEPLLADLRAMFRQMNFADVLARCEQANLPFSPIARPEDLFDDAHLATSGGLLETVLTDGRTTHLPRQPVTVGHHDFGIRQQLAQPGEHTREILAQLDYSPETIAELEKAGIITCYPGIDD